MRVYLVQHGEARPEAEDPERGLTEKGLRDVQRVAGFLRACGLSAGEVWHSGRTRARQTAEILSAVFAGPPGLRERRGIAPKDPVAPVADAIEAAARDVVIVGHLPFLAKLAARLLTGDEAGEVVSFHNGGVVCLEKAGGDRWKLEWAVVPALLGS